MEIELQAEDPVPVIETTPSVPPDNCKLNAKEHGTWFPSTMNIAGPEIEKLLAPVSHDEPFHVSHPAPHASELVSVATKMKRCNPIRCNFVRITLSP
jgi:hypothetical protein